MLWTDHEQDVTRPMRLWVSRALYSDADRAGELPRAPRGLIDNQLWAGSHPEGGNHAVLGGKASLNMKRLPRRALFPLAERHCELERRTEGRALRASGPRTTDVAQHEAKSTPDGRVRAIPLPERSHAHIHADLL